LTKMPPVANNAAIPAASCLLKLERADRDATMAKRVLKILEKALAVHVADRDRLTKRLAPPLR
jgi:hypothetical protein